MCITIVVHDNLFSGLFYILCVIKQIYIVLLRMLASTTSMTITKNVGQQPLPMDTPNQNIQHQADGHQPGKAEGLDLFEKSPHVAPWTRPSYNFFLWRVIQTRHERAHS